MLRKGPLQGIFQGAQGLLCLIQGGEPVLGRYQRRQVPTEHGYGSDGTRSKSLIKHALVFRLGCEQVLRRMECLYSAAIANDGLADLPDHLGLEGGEARRFFRHACLGDGDWALVLIQQGKG